jgi:ribosomal protein S12 methylthiotransferase accessory factor
VNSVEPTAGPGPQTILDAWPDLVDHRTGIVRELAELRIDDDDPPFVHYLSYACSTEAWGFLPNFGNNGGVGANVRTAIAKALGEAVERYCSALVRYDDLVWSAYDRLDEPATSPASFALYRPEQYASAGFPWQPFTTDAPVAWTRGRSLVSGRPVLVPAAFVYVPYHYLRDRPDTPIAQPISTGLACGPSPEDATLAALCEVVERDAFTLMWQARLVRPRIRPGSLPGEVADLVDRYAAVGLTVHLVDITTDVACPTVLAVAEGFVPTSPAIAVAAASFPDPVVAARKSLEELAHTRKFAAQVMDYLPPVPVEVEAGHPAVDGQRAHLRFYCPQEAKAVASFAWSGVREIDLAEQRSCRPSVDALVAEVAASGEDVIACDLTTPDVAELGLAVVRVVVPGFHPLHMGHANRCLGGRRLATLPLMAGVEDWSPARDNPYPHPFP